MQGNNTNNMDTVLPFLSLNTVNTVEVQSTHIVCSPNRPIR